MTSTTVRTIAFAGSTPTADPLAVDTAQVREILRRFLVEEVGKVGFARLVVGLSGGVDSAVVAALAADALGPSNVVCVLMPYRLSSPASEADARAVCDRFGLDPVVVDISPQVDAYFDRFPDASRARRGNKMARERMTVLYDTSLAHDALVVGTSNKTELLLGYGTVFGDMAHALNPIGDLYKTQVFALARALDVPARVIDKAPSADLWEGQSDEAELGFSYADVDRLLLHMVDERYTRAELLALGIEEAFLDRVIGRVRDNQYKRRLPIIAKLGHRTIDRDFRYPRDWGR